MRSLHCNLSNLYLVLHITCFILAITWGYRLGLMYEMLLSFYLGPDFLLLLQLTTLDLSTNGLLGTLPSSLAGLGQASHTVNKLLEVHLFDKLLLTRWHTSSCMLGSFHMYWHPILNAVVLCEPGRKSTRGDLTTIMEQFDRCRPMLSECEFCDWWFVCFAVLHWRTHVGCLFVYHVSKAPRNSRSSGVLLQPKESSAGLQMRQSFTACKLMHTCCCSWHGWACQGISFLGLCPALGLALYR